ncbi:MAG: protealysin inhibitor emfourin [Chloroflexota bacterium]
MTQITFECSGGMLSRRVGLMLDLENLPPRESINLLRLIYHADFFNLPANLVKRPEPEKILYTITVDNGRDHHRVQVSENSAPSALMPLVNELSLRLDSP